MIKFILVMTVLGMMALKVIPVYALCGGPLDQNQFDRPLDYTKRVTKEEIYNLRLVEGAHFTPKVEALIAGATGSLVLDIAYTLKQIPNHYRALSAMSRYQFMHPHRGDERYLSIDCYFERALAFTPTDPNISFLYAIHLHRNKAYDKALTFYKEANRLGLNTAEYHYNLGLLYTDQKEYVKAREQAEMAYSQNYPLPGLRNRLKRAGKW